MYGEIHRMSTRNSLKSCTNSVQRLFLLRNFPLLNSVIFSEMRKSPPWRPASIDLDASLGNQSTSISSASGFRIISTSRWRSS